MSGEQCARGLTRDSADTKSLARIAWARGALDVWSQRAKVSKHTPNKGGQPKVLAYRRFGV